MACSWEAAASFLVYFFLFLLLILDSVESNCSSYFQCGTIGDLKFPLASYMEPECGLAKVECDIRPHPKLYLQNEWFSPSEIVHKLSSNRLYIRNSFFQNALVSEDQSQRCKVFKNYSSPNTPSISFSFSPNISLFICGKSVNLPEFQRYRNYNGCEHLDVYYPIPNDAHRPPLGCSNLVLPINSTSNSDDFFERLGTGYLLEWVVSDKCIDCHQNFGSCTTNEKNEFQCKNALNAGKRKLRLIVLLTVVPVGLVVIFAIILFVHVRSFLKSKKRTQIQKNIEHFLEKHENLAPRRYTYSDLKRITRLFSHKLGEGGFARVYRGTLPEGRDVAVKILKESKGNGEEFINEVASISRTSHVNIVTLLGFCFDGSKRALIYEFMPNGSLEKFIYSNGPLAELHLGWEKLFQIAVGIARGIEYLHQGCKTRILHFDIKPHNILLDKYFNPKISDFGLAKLCPNRSSIVSILGIRGTIGYIAPELVCRNIGQVSHKSDVYSYGMMVLEMVGERKNIDVQVNRTSEIYFPNWIYKHLEQNAKLNLDCVSDEDKNLTIRKMTIVGLWCIQTDPTIRPPMTKVVEMLEGNMESLQIPPKPYISSPPRQEANSSTSETTLTSELALTSLS